MILASEEAKKALEAGKELMFYFPAPSPKFLDAWYFLHQSIFDENRVDCTVKYATTAKYHDCIGIGYFDHWGDFVASLPRYLQGAVWREKNS